MRDKSSTTKKPIPIDDPLLAGMRRYERSGGGRACDFCRVTLRQEGTELAVIVPEAIAKEAGIAIHATVDVDFSARAIVLSPAIGGKFAVRKQTNEKQSRNHGYVLLPIGPDRPLSAKITGKGTQRCEHRVDDTGLTVIMPKSVVLTLN
jgi:antitoxin component of MazEF toxin-antitoxin module